MAGNFEISVGRRDSRYAPMCFRMSHRKLEILLFVSMLFYCTIIILFLNICVLYLFHD